MKRVSKKEQVSKQVGILVHGRHVESVDWEKLVWGEPPYRLGTLPMTALVALEAGLENVAGIVLGTGASKKDGLLEAEYMKKFLLDHLENLSDFEKIKNHPEFDLDALSKVLQDIICELDSQNTDQGIAYGAKILAKLGVNDVRQVTCGSHAPRCMLTALKVQEAGDIPRDQIWSCYGDDMSYAGSEVKDVVVIEPPHRGDDPMIHASIQAHEVLRGIYKVPGGPRRVEALRKIQKILEEAQS